MKQNTLNETFFETNDNPNKILPYDPCSVCGEKSTVMYEYRKMTHYSHYVLKDGEWKEVDNNFVDDGDFDHSEYYCESCYTNKVIR